MRAGLYKSSVTLVLALFRGVRTSEKVGSVEQIESSALQGHVAEASLISAGACGVRRGKSRCLFSSCGPGLTPPAALMLARTSNLRSRAPPRHRGSINRWFQTRSVQREGKQASRLPLPPPSTPRKWRQTRFGDMFLKCRILHFVWIPSPKLAHPQERHFVFFWGCSCIPNMEFCIPNPWFALPIQSFYCWRWQ